LSEDSSPTPDEGAPDTPAEGENVAPPEEHVAAGSGGDVASEAKAWPDSLKPIQDSIDAAAGAINQLSATLQELAPVWDRLGTLAETLRALGRSGAGTAMGGGPPALSVPEVEAKGVEAARFEPAASPEAAPPPSPALASARRVERPVAATGPVRAMSGQAGVYSYTLTVEDSKRRLQLVPLHRALRSVPGVRDMALVGYTHGVATVALEARSSLEAPAIEAAIADTTERQCRIWARGPDNFLVRVGA
jgi:hypothetical protein